MNRDNSQASKDIERRRIERALARLEDAVSRCREEDVCYGLGVSAALEFLAPRADEQWPLNNFGELWRMPGWIRQSLKPAGKCLMPR